jgi:Uncharacterised nucleotidyltransferase/Transglutaminase-like superfamily
MPTGSRLAQLLIQDPPDVQPGDLDLLLASGLAAEVASRMPADHPLLAALQPARLTLLARQMIIRRSVQSLLAAWNGAGISAVLLKGFALAEFEYATPGTRPYADVDVLLHQADLEGARAAALHLGWRDDGYSQQPAIWTHEMAHFTSPDGQVQLDVHRSLFEGWPGNSRKVQRINSAVWKKARTAQLGGIPVLLPDPHDQVLTGLALGRSWTMDRGHLKPTDYPDLKALICRHRLTPEGLAKRAAELGVGHTWAAYLQQCDPWRGVFRLGDQRAAATLRWAARRDGQHRRLVDMFRLLARLPRLPRMLLRLAWTLPDALAVWRMLRVPGDPRLLPAAFVLDAGQPLPSHQRVRDLVLSAGRVTHLLYPRSQGRCVPRSLATYRALLRHGFPAVYVSGVRRTPGGQIEGHAWVEGPEGVLESYGEPLNRHLYKVLFEHCADEQATLHIPAHH